MFRVPRKTFKTGVLNALASFALWDYIDFNDRTDHQFVEFNGAKVFVGVDTTDIQVNYQSLWEKKGIRFSQLRITRTA